jgi:hypothetical protein
MWWAQLLNNLIAVLDAGAGGAAGSFESIATATGTGSSGTITFTSIPSTYKHLQLRIRARSSRAATSDFIIVQFNSDTGSNYAHHQLEGDGATASASGAATQANAYVGRAPGTSVADTNIMGVSIVDIHDYASTTKNKTTRAAYGFDANGSGYSTLGSGLWQNTSAISTVSVKLNIGNFLTSSTIALYGIKGA